MFSLETCIQKAAARVSCDAQAALEILGLESGLNRGASERGAWKGLYGSGLHCHACVEVCFVVQGACCLWTSEGARSASSERFVVVPPDVLHCEGWADKRRGYQLLWLVFGGGACTAFTNRYRPGRGWQAGERISVNTAAASSVTQALRDLTGDS